MILYIYFFALFLYKYLLIMSPDTDNKYDIVCMYMCKPN